MASTAITPVLKAIEIPGACWMISQKPTPEHTNARYPSGALRI
jgi:hypothetical protein